MSATDLPIYPHHAQAERARRDAEGADVEPTGWTRNRYLDLAEPIVRTAIEWQDETGAIIDPVEGEETVTCGARFVGALAALIAAGRCVEHVEACARAMDLQTERIAIAYGEPGHADAADFNTRDLMLAMMFVAPRVARERAAEWSRRLAAVHPDDLYDCGANTPPDVTHNWVIYAIVGEYLKTAAGIADTNDWIEGMLAQQLPLFTSDGAYRDPNCPITYDITCRQGLSWMLDRGYDGPQRAQVDEILRRGALTTLLTISPTGEAPFGGRSNQFHHMEAMIACFCEFEAKRYAMQGDMVLAGAFKRQARLSAGAVAPWIIETDPWRHIKNRFPPTSLHGCDGYGLLAVYGLLAANLLGVAYWMADDGIPEAPSFSEVGGRVIAVDAEFHKVYATCAGTHLQIDTCADPHYDATGLGRFHRAGVPSFLGLSSPFAADRSYMVATGRPPKALAIGPGRRVGNEWVHLAELSGEITDVTLHPEREDSDVVAFELIYRLSSSVGEVREHYQLSEGRAEVRTRIVGADRRSCLRAPLWTSDGELEADPKVLRDGFSVKLGEHEYEVEWTGPTPIRTSIDPERIANRNGVYRVGRIEVEGCELAYELNLH